MKRSEKQRLGRLAIEQIKTAYLDGRAFEGAVAIRAYCLSELGVKPAFVTLGIAAAWDRQARYELADARSSVTSPVASNRYLRDPNATPEERESSRTPVLKDLSTRASNVQRMLTADASQSNATRAEIRREERIRIISELTASLTADESVAEKILAEALQD